MLYGASYEETIVTSQVDGVAVTAAAATTVLPGAAKFTIPANYFQIGKQLLIKAAGRVSVVVTTPGTARFDVRLGGVIVFDSQAIALDPVAYTNVGWYLEIMLTCRAIGTTGNLMGQGTLATPILAGNPATPPKGSLIALLPWNAAPAVGNNFDTTVSNVLDLFWTQTVASGSITCHQYSAQTLN